MNTDTTRAMVQPPRSPRVLDADATAPAAAPLFQVVLWWLFESLAGVVLPCPPVRLNT